MHHISINWEHVFYFQYKVAIGRCVLFTLVAFIKQNVSLKCQQNSLLVVYCSNKRNIQKIWFFTLFAQIRISFLNVFIYFLDEMFTKLVSFVLGMASTLAKRTPAAPWYVAWMASTTWWALWAAVKAVAFIQDCIQMYQDTWTGWRIG